MSPRSAYVHVPFCRHRCGYCNFTLIAKRDDLIEGYLRAIELELSRLGGPQPVDTLFFGGGTPTHLSPKQLKHLFELTQQWLPVTNGGEISIEANPEDIDAETADELASNHVTRVSLGVQSFHTDKLRTLERGHTAKDVNRCVEMLRPHIPSLSIDLIFGAPKECIAEWNDDLQSGLSLSPHHLSTYGLTYERGTRFFARQERKELQPVDEDAERAMYALAIDLLTREGFEHYEVSNFARPGHRCRHNENYWNCGEFFGFGPGASRYVNGVRQSNHRSTTRYLKLMLRGDSPVDESEQLSQQDKARERLVFGLRQMRGVDIDAFRDTTGFDVHELAGENLEWLLQEALLEVSDGRIRLTRKGLFVSDSIWPHFL